MRVEEIASVVSTAGPPEDLPDCLFRHQSAGHRYHGRKAEARTFASRDLARDVEIDIGCIFEGRVELGDGVVVGAHSVLRNVTIAAGTRIAHIPYKGVAPAVNDLIGGHVPTTFMTWGPIAPYVGGKVAALAVADSQRSALAPNVPTLAELGVKDVEVSAWQGLFGPKGMSPETVKLLNTHLNEILKMPDVVSKMATFGALPAGGEPARLEKTNAADFNRFGKLINDLDIRAD